MSKSAESILPKKLSAGLSLSLLFLIIIIPSFNKNAKGGDMPRGKIISTDPHSPHVESLNNEGDFLVIKPGKCYPNLKKGTVIHFKNVTVNGRARGVFEYYNKNGKDKLKRRLFVSRHDFKYDDVTKQIIQIGDYKCP